MSKNKLLLAFGALALLIGIVLNVKMYIDEAWPTYLFYILCVVGVVQIVIALLIKKIKIGWQVLWIVLPYLMFLLLFLLKTQ